MSLHSSRWDLQRLRKERLHKLQKELQARQIGAALFTSPLGIRYAMGISVMPLWTAVNQVRYAFIPAEGEPVLFEYGKALFLTKPIWPESKASVAWQFRFSQHEAETQSKNFAKELKGLMKEKGVPGEKIGIDSLDAYGFNALKSVGLNIVDADESLQAARLIKTQDELELMKYSCAVCEAALYEMEGSIQPGVTENELLAKFWGKMLMLGGEHCSTRLLVSGEKTNPWFQEAGDRMVRPGDLVAIDTDMIGPEGYLCDVSRTFLCGNSATGDQKEAYRVAYDFIHGVMELCQAGEPYENLRAKAPRIPEQYREQAYPCLIHGCGLDDEPPFIPLAQDESGVMPGGSLEENMVVSIEFYAGKKGGKDGVKLEDQVLITREGPRLMSEYPYEEKLIR